MLETAAIFLGSFAIGFGILKMLEKFHVWMETKRIDIPGKTPDWIIGNIRDLYKNPLEGVANLYRFGRDGIASVYIFGRQTFIVGYPEYLVKVFKCYSRYPSTSVHSIAFMGLRSIVHLVGREWLGMRKIINMAFNSRHFRNMSGHIFDRASASVDLFEKIEDEFDVTDVMKVITSDIITLIAFGYPSNNIENYGDCTNSVSQDFDFLQMEKSRREASLNPIWSFYWLPLPINKEYKRRRQNIVNTISNIMDYRRQFPLDDASDFLEAITVANREDGSKLSKDDIIDQLFTIMFAGYDTTSVTLSFALWLISQHPQVEDQILQEIDSVPLTYERVRDLKYIDAVIKETLRLYPPAPITSRSLDKDTTFDKATLPHGSFIWIPIDLVHHDPKFWDNPKEFDPSRFHNKPDPQAFMAFSQGPRNCPGMSLAMMEMKILLAILLKKFKFVTMSDQEIVPDYIGFVLRPKNGIRMKVEKRE